MPGPKYPNAQTEADWFRTIINGLDVGEFSVRTDEWWKDAARSCIRAGHAHLITSRCGTVVYMLRCWLSSPKPTTRTHIENYRYESGDSVLLHWILQPDDVPYLHNHPWMFTTRILAGGYQEEREDLSRCYKPGMCTAAGLGDFHRIASHLDGPGDPTTGQGGTWSLVTTGPRVQPWSFLIDGCERDAETFLRQKRDQEAAGTQLRIDTP